MLDHRVETFLMLCKTMNYRKTAEILNMTQPAVTQHIHFLENEYKCRLFQYDGRKLKQTKEAQILQRHYQSMLYNQRMIMEELRQSPDTHLKIGATKTIGEYLIPTLAKHFIENTHDLLDLTVKNTKELLKDIENGTLDFALIEGRFNKNQFGWRLYRNEPFVGICALNHPFANQTVTIEDLFHETLLLREKGSGTREIFYQTLVQKSYTLENFQKQMVISNFATILNLTAANLGISFVYETVANFAAEKVAVFRFTPQPIMGQFNYVFLKNTSVEDKILYFETAQKKSC